MTDTTPSSPTRWQQFKAYLSKIAQNTIVQHSAYCLALGVVLTAGIVASRAINTHLDNEQQEKIRREQWIAYRREKDAILGRREYA